MLLILSGGHDSNLLPPRRERLSGNTPNLMVGIVSGQVARPAKGVRIVCQNGREGKLARGATGFSRAAGFMLRWGGLDDPWIFSRVHAGQVQNR